MIQRKELKLREKIKKLKEFTKSKFLKKETALVILESPYAGDTVKNVQYGRAALRDSLLRGEAPIASHLLYTQPGVLNDLIPSEREYGINAGLAWGKVTDYTVVYVDLGVSKGMAYGIEKAKREGRRVEFRTIAGWHNE